MSRTNGLDVIGAWSDSVTDYDYGETKVIEMVQFFNALGRPVEFEADAERVYTAYQNAKVSWLADGKAIKWMHATAMKQVGADAAIVMDKLRESGAHGSGRASASKLIPSQIDNPYYKPDDGWPWWVWASGAVVFGGGALYFAWPVVAALGASVIGRVRRKVPA